jgi:hypothetical protein
MGFRKFHAPMTMDEMYHWQMTTPDAYTLFSPIRPILWGGVQHARELGLSQTDIHARIIRAVVAHFEQSAADHEAGIDKTYPELNATLVQALVETLPH